MKTVYFVSAVALMIAPVSASAADAVFQTNVVPVPPVTVPVKTTYDWSGAYVGVTAGGLVDNKKLPGVKSFKDSSFVGGIHAGYNHQTDENWVLGVEGDINIAKRKKNAPVSLKQYATARVRAGYAIDRFLPYVDGGVVVAKLDTHGAKGKGRTHLGYTLGGGLEYAVTDNITTRISYHYVDLKNRDYSIGGKTQAVGYKGHTIGAGLSFKF
jgi:outer membrane immunogenic protein